MTQPAGCASVVGRVAPHIHPRRPSRASSVRASHVAHDDNARLLPTRAASSKQAHAFLTVVTSPSARRLRGRPSAQTIVCAADVATTGGRGGGTPGSWNLGVAHSEASGSDQRSYVDRLFAAYGPLVEAAKMGDVAGLEEVMDGVYAAAPDKSTRKIRDAQIRAAALGAVAAGQGKTLAALLDRGADLGLNDGDDAHATCDPNAVGGDGGATEVNGCGTIRRRNTKTTMAIEAAAAGHDEVLDVLFQRCGEANAVDARPKRTSCVRFVQPRHRDDEPFIMRGTRVEASGRRRANP